MSEMTIDDLGILLGNLKHAQQSTDDGPQLPEAKVAILREVYERYQWRNPFELGDLVTPRPDAMLTSFGEPHIVLEVLRPADVKPHFKGPPKGTAYGARLDMRVALIASDGIAAPFWIESWMFEEWSPPEDSATADPSTQRETGDG